MIYTPREDSFLLAEEVKKRARGKKVLDVGCGSGIQMETALESGAKEVLGIDVDSEVVEHCKSKGLNVVKSDLFGSINGTWDLIMFNPPYLPEDVREDKESSKITSGGKRGDEIIVRFLGSVRGHLEKGGEILLVVSSLTPTERIERVLKDKSMEKKVVATKKMFMEVLEVWKLI